MFIGSKAGNNTLKWMISVRKLVGAIPLVSDCVLLPDGRAVPRKIIAMKTYNACTSKHAPLPYPTCTDLGRQHLTLWVSWQMVFGNIFVALTESCFPLTLWRCMRKFWLLVILRIASALAQRPWPLTKSESLRSGTGILLMN